MKKFNKKKLETTWETYEDDVEFQIRPFKLLALAKLPNEDDFQIEQMWNMFNYVLTDWKGVEDESGPMECNEENKDIVFNYDQDIVVFCINKASEMREGVTEKELKNSGNLQSGTEAV